MNDSRPVLLDNARAWRTYLGGSMIRALHGHPGTPDDHYPEEWIMSVVAARNAGRETDLQEGMSHLCEAPGPTLASWLAQAPSERLGKAHAAANGADTGVLLKLIDSAERLSIQVHPDREQARRLFASPFGKTECWHILGGRTMHGEAPYIYFGFRPGITRERWKELFEKQDIAGMLACLHRFEVQPGDTFLIEGGVPHAIGAGCFLAEIQEPTDFTIRTERTTPSGFAIADVLCHQGLGFEAMFDCFHYGGLTKQETESRWKIRPVESLRDGPNAVCELIGYQSTPYFAMNRVDCATTLTLPPTRQFYALYVLEGAGEMACADAGTPIRQGDQVFVPADCPPIGFTAHDGQPLRVLQAFGPVEK